MRKGTWNTLNVCLRHSIWPVDFFYIGLYIGSYPEPPLFRIERGFRIPHGPDNRLQIFRFDLPGLKDAEGKQNKNIDPSGKGSIVEEFLPIG